MSIFDETAYVEAKGYEKTVTPKITISWEGTNPEALRKANHRTYEEVMDRLYFAIGATFAFAGQPQEVTEFSAATEAWCATEAEFKVVAYPPSADDEWRFEKGYIPVQASGQVGKDIWGVAVLSYLPEDGTGWIPVVRGEMGGFEFYI